MNVLTRNVVRASLALAILSLSANVLAQADGGTRRRPAAPAPTPQAPHARDAGTTHDADAAAPSPDASTTSTSTDWEEADAGNTTPSAPSDPDAGATPSTGSQSNPEPANSESENAEAPPVAPEEPPQPLTPEQQALLTPSPGEMTSQPVGRFHRFLLPPYLDERGEDYHTRVLFPVYFESRVHDEHRWVVPPYYRLRSATEQGDAFFPLFLHFRGHDHDTSYSTDFVFPAWAHSSHGPGRAHAQAFGAFPFFSYNEEFNSDGRLQREHLVIPALLTYHQWWPYGQATIVGPVVYFRMHSEVNWAVVPFVFHHSTPAKSWTLIPPLLAYRSHSYDDNTTFTLVGPFFTESGPTLSSYNLAPIFFYRHDGTHTRLTILPLFHSEFGPNRFALVTALGGYVRNGDESTLVTPIYQNHRGLTNVDAIAPFFFYSRTPRLGSMTVALLPFGFYSTSPTNRSWGVFPLVARFHNYGQSDTIATPLFVHSNQMATNSSTTWIFPSIHIEHHPDSHLLNIYPLVFSAAGHGWHHTVLFPFYYDFTNDSSALRVNVVWPFFVRVQNHGSIIQYTFPNHLYWESIHDGQRSFAWDLFPFIQYGEPRRGDVNWSILEGLIGYHRNNGVEQGEAFWVRFGMHGSASRPTTSPRPQARRQPNGDVLLDM